MNFTRDQVSVSSHNHRIENFVHSMLNVSTGHARKYRRYDLSARWHRNIAGQRKVSPFPPSFKPLLPVSLHPILRSLRLAPTLPSALSGSLISYPLLPPCFPLGAGARRLPVRLPACMDARPPPLHPLPSISSLLLAPPSPRAYPFPLTRGVPAPHVGHPLPPLREIDR